MALATIEQMVYDNLPFLDSTDTPTQDVVNREITKTYYILSDPLGKTTDIETETSYTEKQRILIAYYASYSLLLRRTTESAQGNASSGTAGGGKQVKKAKADVTEVEFAFGKDAGISILDAEKLLKVMLLNACSCAKALNIELSICMDENVSSPYTQFIYVPNC